jgi:hypothetical protein
VLDGSTIQTGVFAEGASMTTMTPVPAAATKVTYTSLGAISDPLGDNNNPDGTPIITQVLVSSSTGVAGARNLIVLVGGGTGAVATQAGRAGVKICDPKWPPTDPKGCPV